MYYAHSRNDSGDRQDLVDHLHNVADIASRFAADFAPHNLVYALGLWHDLGKFNPKFQEYLFACEADPKAHSHGPDHKAAGAQFALDRKLWPLALLIQAHHGGLKTRTDLQSWLKERGSDPAIADALARARQTIENLDQVGILTLPEHTQKDPVAAELFLRLLFSALVDADYLDTEQHFSANKALKRGSDITLPALWERFERNRQRLPRRVGPVHDARNAIYDACLAAAELPPGLFRLTVPTGGGKTLSGMAFALKHAIRHGHRRVIVAVPFISITEQTAGVYRDIFDAVEQDDERPVVLEHHSSASADNDASDPKHVWARLAAENWDAPIIVTTTVQLLESLFANKTSRGRKNHRLTRSVIILDEAQALPAHLLTPILDGLRQLCAYYGATVVISTATQPAFDDIPVFAAVPAREIVPDPAHYFNVLKRVEYDWRTKQALSWTAIVGILRSETSALTVVNTKKDALALLDALNDPDALHLSTLLCGAHRRTVIAEVKRRLKAGEPCLLVSTQVVEAGVDLDFPLVLRALGPLDGIIQAAGRCNREGLLERGRVIVFRPEEGGIPQGAYRTGAGITGSLLGSGDIDPDDPAVSRRYFQQLFQSVDTDAREIQKMRQTFDYPKVAQCFRMIDEDTESVAITRYGSDDEQRKVRWLLEQLRNGSPNARVLLRRLQPYLVSVRTREAEGYKKQGLILPVTSGVGEWHGRYDLIRGLMAEGPSADTLVV